MDDLQNTYPEKQYGFEEQHLTVTCQSALPKGGICKITSSKEDVRCWFKGQTVLFKIVRPVDSRQHA